MFENPASGLARVREVLDRLLDPDHGCPWDLKQTPATIRSYLLEETYELLDALESEDEPNIQEEMGDCLFLLCFLAHWHEGRGRFTLARVLDSAADKMIGRHPHVFGDARALETPDQVKAQWQEIKKKEKAGSLLAGVPRAMPALMRAHRLSERVGRVGFDWNGPASVFETLNLELVELRAALASGDRDETSRELGDVLFTLTNLARHLKINAEEALGRANDRFQRRFNYIEEHLAAEGRDPSDSDLKEMDRLWADAKEHGL